MTQYIDKSALVAEIERLENDEFLCDSYDEATGFQSALRMVQEFIDTLEVKEVDINNEISQFIDANFEKATIGHKLSLRRVARHFFELGLKAQSKDMIEALRTEYEKGRADVIADTLSWLENCWPKYCYNHTIIDAYKEGVVKD